MAKKANVFADLEKAESAIKRWEKTIGDPKKFQPIMRAEYGRAFDNLEKARAAAVAADPIGYVARYPGHVMAYQDKLPRELVQRMQAASTDAEAARIASSYTSKPADPGIRKAEKPRTPFESPPKGATDGRLRTDRKPTTRPGPAAKPKTPVNAAAALDAVTRDAKQVVATERAIKKDASLNTNAVRERAVAPKRDSMMKTLSDLGKKDVARVYRDVMGANPPAKMSRAKMLDQIDLRTKASGKAAFRNEIQIGSAHDTTAAAAKREAMTKVAEGRVQAAVERTRPTTAKTKAPTVAELKAQAKAQGLKGYSKMTKAQLSQALGNGPAGWSDAAREASAKVRGAKAADTDKLRAKLQRQAVSGQGRADLLLEEKQRQWAAKRIAEGGNRAAYDQAAYDKMTKSRQFTREDLNTLQATQGKKVKLPNGHTIESTWYRNPAKTAGDFSVGKNPHAGARLNPEQAAAKYNAWIKAGKPKKGPGALTVALGVGVSLYALSRGASTAEAAEAGLDTATMGAVSNAKAHKAAGSSTLYSAAAGVAEAAFDFATGGYRHHFADAKARGLSDTSAYVGAAFKAAGTKVSVGLGDLASYLNSGGKTFKAPDVRKASAKQQAIYAAKAKKESAMAASRQAQPAAKPEGPTGMVAAHRKRVNGKTVSVEARRMTPKEIRARAM